LKRHRLEKNIIFLRNSIRKEHHLLRNSTRKEHHLFKKQHKGTTLFFYYENSFLGRQK
jgi:hypothetical protein